MKILPKIKKYFLPKKRKKKFLGSRKVIFLPKPKKIFFGSKTFWTTIFLIFLSSFLGFLGGVFSLSYFYKDFFEIPGVQKVIRSEKLERIIEKQYIPQTTQEEAIIKAVKKASPAVVSIIITKDVPVFEQYYINPFKEFEEIFGEPFGFKIPQYRQKGTEKKEIGGGTGFIISKDGLVLTNKHVVLDKDAQYTVFTNEGEKFEAEVLARDPVQDIAVLKIKKPPNKVFPVVKLGDSDKLQIGQTVIAIGNVLGEFRNSVSVGVISGLGRRITASGGGLIETIENVIQTDAAINKGNSGGPLLNLKGEVIGINTATVLGAQSVGFAIPINQAKRDIEQVKTTGKIIYPFLGVRYVLVTPQLQKENNLKTSYGALIVKGEQGEPGVVPGSAADKAGLKEGDIILEVNGERITPDNSLGKIIMKYQPGQEVSLKVWHKTGKIEFLKVKLGERTSE